MPNKKQKDDGSLPNELINRLFQETVGGFCLFYFNQETGHPEQLMNFDSPVHALALQKHIADFTEAIHEVSINNSVRSIEQTLEDSGSDEEKG